MHTPDEGDAYKNLYLYGKSNPLFYIDPSGLKDRTDDIVSLYANRTDLTVAEKVGLIVADIYADAANSTPSGLFQNRDIINTVQSDVGDTFSSGSAWGPGDGRTTFNTLSGGGVQSGFQQSFTPNADDFARHLGATFQNGQVMSVGYQLGDTIQGWVAQLGGAQGRAQESSSEATMDSAFRGLLHDISNMVGSGSSRLDVYNRTVQTFTQPAK